jgi:hypothetical protein
MAARWTDLSCSRPASWSARSASCASGGVGCQARMRRFPSATVATRPSAGR